MCTLQELANIELKRDFCIKIESIANFAIRGFENIPS